MYVRKYGGTNFRCLNSTIKVGLNCVFYFQPWNEEGTTFGGKLDRVQHSEKMFIMGAQSLTSLKVL